MGTSLFSLEEAFRKKCLCWVFVCAMPSVLAEVPGLAEVPHMHL